jgi:glycosyltransferase involved in cell wall biosynthesis
MSAMRTDRKARWLVIAHEASNSGAPLMLLAVLNGVRKALGPEWECEMIFNRGGPLLGDFAKLGRVHKVCPDWMEGAGVWVRGLRALRRLWPFKPAFFVRSVEDWRAQGGGIVYSNTGTNGWLLAALPEGAGPVVSHVHELGYGLRRFNLPWEWRSTLRRTDLFLAVSAAVKADLVALGAEEGRIRRVANFITDVPAVPDKAVAREAVCRQLGLPVGTRLVTTCGHIDHVKGTDLFVDVAKMFADAGPAGPVFVCVGGDGDGRFAREVRERSAGVVKFVGEVKDPEFYFAASEVVLVTSRVESFCRVVLEAGALGRPVLAFAAARGPAEVLPVEALVSELSAEAMAWALRGLLSDEAKAAQAGAQLRQRIIEGFTSDRWISAILTCVDSLQVEEGK